MNDAADDAKPIASTRHLVGFAVICAAFTALAYAGRSSSGHAAGAPPPGQEQLVSLYLGTIVSEVVLLYYVWRGVRKSGGNLFALAVRWRTPLGALVDVAAGLALGFALLTLDAYVHHLFGDGSEASVADLLPRTPLEIVVWIAVASTAGAVEEFVFRGYLIRQLSARLQSVPLAVAAQAGWFSIMHVYEGVHSVVPICAIGLIFGLVVVWRKQLRTNIVAHACFDVVAGWAPNLIRF